jgi:hypothetical protein
MAECRIPECDRDVFVEMRGLCRKHYERAQRRGELGSRPNPEERFLALISKDETTGCWIWTGFRDHRGYGVFWAGTRSERAYRWAYLHWVGPVAKGLHLDHYVCDNPSCCNPGHLRPTTPRENILRGRGVAPMHAAKTHCKHGHEFTPENTIRRPDGCRECRECRRRIQRANNAKRRRKV